MNSSIKVYVDGNNYVAVRARDNVVVASGNNAHMVLQAAIIDIESGGGGKLSIAAGTYPLGSTLTITKPKIVIEGAGPLTVLDFNISANQHGLDFSSMPEYMRGGPALRDLVIEGPAIEGQGTGRGINLDCVPAYPAVIIENVRLYNWGVGIYLNGCLCSTVIGCFINACGLGIHVEESNGTVIIGTNVENGFTGIYVTFNQNLNIMGGTVENNRGTGIHLYKQASATTIDGVYFENNAIANNLAYYDIHLTGELEGYVPNQVVIRSCYHSGLPGYPGAKTGVQADACGSLTFMANRHMASDRTPIRLGSDARKVLGPIYMLGGIHEDIINRETYKQIIVDLRSKSAIWDMLLS